MQRIDETLALAPFVDGLAFPESPRWHEGTLWFSDFYMHAVSRAAPDGRVEPVCEVAGQPSGLGWLPDGRLLVVSMNERRVLRREHDGWMAVHADLSQLAPAPCNDMLVDAQGRAYVGNFGFDLAARAPFAPTRLLVVDTDGSVRVAATDMHFPNGTVRIGDTLVVAESYGQRLTAFDVQDDGSLANRRVWAQFDGKRAPDGICADAEGAIWVACPVSREVIRVREGGEVTHRIATGDQAVACALGGDGLRTLYVCTGKVMVTPQQSREMRTGAIRQVRVDVPGHP